MEAMRGYLLRDVQWEKTLGSTDAGLSFLEVKTEADRNMLARFARRRYQQDQAGGTQIDVQAAKKMASYQASSSQMT